MEFAAGADKSYVALSRHYDACLRRYGDIAQGADWPNEADRQTRFSVMLDVLAADTSERVDLLDFACGTGELYRRTQHIEKPLISYQGVDISDLAVQYARGKFPNAQFRCLDILAATEQELTNCSADYCIINGLFTVKQTLSQRQMWDFMAAVLARLWPVTRKAIAFNVMSKQVERERDDLFHVSLDQMAQFLYEFAGRSVVLRSDYGLFEFTCYVRRRPQTFIAARSANGIDAATLSRSDVGAVCRPLLPTAAEIMPYLADIDRRRWYANFGETVRSFEARLAAQFGLDAGQCVAASSGTDALAAALIAVAGRGRMERPYCLMPSYTFVGTAAAALNAGYEPYFLDIDPQSLALAPARLAGHPLLRRCGAIIVVAPYGRPVVQSGWEELSWSAGVPVVIDAAAGFDAVAAAANTLGSLPVMVSLHATKVFGIGEGGIILCRDAELIGRCRRVLNFGFLGSRDALLPGFNGKMSEYHAAVGLAALASWSRTRAGFLATAAAYRRAAQRSGLAEKIIAETAWASSYALYRAESAAAAAAAKQALSRAGIDFRLWYGTGCHGHAAYAGCGRDPLPVTEDVAPRVIGLPVSVDLPADAIGGIVAALANI